MLDMADSVSTWQLHWYLLQNLLSLQLFLLARLTFAPLADQ